MTKTSPTDSTFSASARLNDAALVAAADAALRADAIFHRVGAAISYPDAAAETDWRKAGNVRNALIEPLLGMRSATVQGIRAKAAVVAAIANLDWSDECTNGDRLLVSLLRDLAAAKPA
jgi:hypothetical protein